MMRRITRNGSLLLPVACLLGLAACHHETKTGDQRTASGEVLAGSISDSMIPYEALKSKPPLAPREAGSRGRKAGPDNAADPADLANTAADAPPAEGDAAPAANSAAPTRY